jgi:Predicted membrane protein (DUF2207)
MVGVLAIAAAAGWLLVFFGCAVVTRLRPPGADAGLRWPGVAGQKPAVVNLAVTRCRLNGAAYAATILDLASRGYLVITPRGTGELWCDVTAPAPADTGLAESERLVLAGVRKLAGPGGAPFEAVAESCASDVRGTWDPFERAVRAEGRQTGITRARLPWAMQAPLYVGAGVVGVLAFAAVDALPHTSGVWAPLVAAFFAFTVPVTLVGSLSQKDRLTGHGSAMGAWAAREAADATAGWRHPGPVPASSPAELSALALAVAAGAPVQVPGGSPGLAAGVRPGRATARSAQSEETPRPAVAWSSLGGQWRLVRIGPTSYLGLHPAVWLPLAAVLAVLSFGTSLLPSPFGQLLPVLLAAGAAAAAIAGVRGLAVRLAKPAEVSFQGQVIARWVQRHGDNDNDWDAPCIAVDDGERSWSFDVSHAAFGKLALGDTVMVRASPRSGKLLSLVPLREGMDRDTAAPAQPAADLLADEEFLRVTPGPPNPLLAAEEVSAAVGRPVEATGFQLGILGGIYRGADLTVSLTVAQGAMSHLSSGPARRWGRALLGIGDEAWQLIRDQTVVFKMGTYTGKVTVSGSAARGLVPDVPARLAATVAARLAALADRSPSGNPSPGTSGEPSGSFSEPSGSFSEPSGSFSEPSGSFSEPPGTFSEPPGTFQRTPRHLQRPPRHLQRAAGSIQLVAETVQRIAKHPASPSPSGPRAQPVCIRPPLLVICSPVVNHPSVRDRRRALSPCPHRGWPGHRTARRQNLSVDVLAIVAAGLWLLAFGWCAVVSNRPSLRAGAADPGLGLAPEKPALVNLAVRRCRLNGAAYPATILDLAASGYLAITERQPGQLWCDVPASTPEDIGLARPGSLVLAGVRALAAGDGAPFEALAESCASDVRGRWDPFERAVRAEGRRAEITRPRLAVTARILLYAGAAGVGALAFAAVQSRSSTGLWVPAVIAFFAVIVSTYWVYSLGRQDRLTVHGSALGAQAARAAGDMAAAAGAPGPMAVSSPAELRQLAWAVAAGAPVQIPGATPGLATGVRPGRGRAGAWAGISGQFAGTPRPSAAWSSFGGRWRLVRIGPASSTRMHPAFWLVLAAWLALISYVSSLLSGPVGVLIPAVLAAGSIAAVIGGARGLAAWRARPAETSFQAQVIARWVEHRSASDDDSSVTRIALDDGERSWSFDVKGAALGQLALGDVVTVRASPRSGKLLSLAAGQDGPDGAAVALGQPWAAAGGAETAGGAGTAAGDAGADTRDGDRPGTAAADEQTGPGALLAAGEVSAAVGRPVRAAGLTPRAGSVVYRGEGLTVIVTAADNFLGSLTALARRRGLPLPGVGDEAWLLNRGRTAVLRVGELTARVSVGGSAARSLPPDALARLAAAVAERLPRPAGSQRLQA